ncbi:NurA domain protein [uncultured archaeon]|nr:NurA domain protein [uncultured archaeon]
MGISSVIEQTVKAIHSGEQRKKSVAERLGPLKKGILPSGCESFPENGLAFTVQDWVPQGLVAGVDSGFVAKRLASVDLVIIRAVGVVFDYKNGVVDSTKYFPDYFHFPEPHLSSGSLEQDEAEQSKSLMRLREEVGVMKKVIELHSPKYLFIDGSIVPQFQDKPRKESALTGNYSDIITEFESLYAVAEKHGCTLIATVEDSRGSRFRQILQDDILGREEGAAKKLSLIAQDLDGLSDSAILDYFLEVGERSCAFTYTKSISQHPVLQDFNSKWSKGIYGLYIKPAVLDRPLRCEFICHGGLKEKADEVASVALALSSMHREYAFPSVLIEADLRAKLHNDEIDLVFNKIWDKLGAGVKLRMRRENRPF